MVELPHGTLLQYDSMCRDHNEWWMPNAPSLHCANCKKHVAMLAPIIGKYHPGVSGCAFSTCLIPVGRDSKFLRRNSCSTHDDIHDHVEYLSEDLHLTWT